MAKGRLGANGLSIANILTRAAGGSKRIASAIEVTRFAANHFNQPAEDI